MDRFLCERVNAANRELNEFLRKVDGLSKGTEAITEHDLQSLSQLLSTLAPEVAKVLNTSAPAQGRQDDQQGELLGYFENLRTLQTALETVRCVMLARKTELDGARRHLHGLQSWVNAYNQTT